jgi:hypothetical protein
MILTTGAQTVVLLQAVVTLEQAGSRGLSTSRESASHNTEGAAPAAAPQIDVGNGGTMPQHQID